MAIDGTFWRTTFREHGSSVLAFLSSRVGRRDVAEDLLQETFVRAMRRKADLPDPAKMRSYLMTTAFHLIVDQRRRRRPALFSEVSDRDARALERAPDRSSPSPDRLIDLRRLEEHLGDALASLRPAWRTAFEEAVLRQRPYAEIAGRQGWTLQQVRVNVHRARKDVIARLRHILDAVQETPS